MLHHLKQAWLTVAADPLLITLALLVPSFVLIRTGERPAGWSRLVAYRHHFFILLSALMIFLYLAMCGTYLFSHAFVDHIEPSVASVSWLFREGKPVYHDLIQPQRYSLLYGPYLYIFVGTSQAMLGPSVFSTKLPSAFAAVAAIALMFFAFCRKSTFRCAFYLTGLAATTLLGLFVGVLFWVRSDPLILLTVALGVFAMTLDGILGSILLGLSLGVGINLKIHACVYFLPLLYLAVRQWNIPKLIIAITTAALTAVLPFVVFPNISLNNYAGFLKMAAGHGFSLWLFSKNVELFLMLMLPLGLILVYEGFCLRDENQRRFGQQHGYIVAIIAACLIMFLPASKNGSGPAHLMSFVPVLVFVGARYLRSGPSAGDFSGRTGRIIGIVATAWIATCFLEWATWSVGWFYHYTLVREDSAKSCIRDVQIIVRTHSGEVILAGIGSEDSYPNTEARMELVFAGMAPGIDPGALVDIAQSRLGQIDLARLVGDIEKQYDRRVIWIIPKNSIPFSMPNWYSEYSTVNPHFEPLYPRTFTDNFAKMYVRSASTAFYDIYTPVNAGSPSDTDK